MKNLVIPYYDSGDKDEMSLIHKCILWNTNHDNIKNIYVVCDRKYSRFKGGHIASDKFKLMPIGREPTLQDCHNVVLSNDIESACVMPPNQCYFHSDGKGKINISFPVIFSHHRSGWKYALLNLQKLHKDDGVLLDSFVEHNFSWSFNRSVKLNIIPYTSPWIGILHDPPDIPPFFSTGRRNFLDTSETSMQHCKGLFCLSNYHADWLRKHVKVPVNVLRHPTQTPKIQFNFNQFLINYEKKLLHIGWWLRNFNSFKELNVSYRKIMLTHISLDDIKEFIVGDGGDLNNIPEYWGRVPDNDYDKLLSKNIVFIDLYSSSANNVVVECIVRNTPVLVRKIPAVVEYLGAEYPLYFTNLKDAEYKCNDYSLIRDASLYLEKMDKRIFSGNGFYKSFIESEIYRSLT